MQDPTALGQKAQGTIYLIPVELGPTPQQRVLPPFNRELILGIRHFIVEEIRSALTFYPMGKHADAALFEKYLRPLESGYDIGIISEAGCPAVADPGADVVAIAQRKGFRVVPLVGPSSMIMAVMASGLNGQSFAFNGYLPIDPSDRVRRIKQLETRAVQEHQTQLFIETPYRNHKFFDTLCQTLRPQTRLCIAAGITTDDEWIRTRTVSQWRHTPLPDLSKTPAIFLFGE